ncbi:MAG: hypothetical protein KDB61_12300, partial [Planctomycetes bacterium]|nr:hypothetical protein [Planctomycetota bacterium]
MTTKAKSTRATKSRAVKDVAEAIEETVKVAAKPPKQAPKAAPKAAPKEVAVAPAPKLTIKIGDEAFDLIEGADAKDIASKAKAVAKAADAIQRKDNDLLASYFAIGEFAASVAPMFASPKVYGQYLAKAAPASASLDPALRSNCKWLWEAVNDEEHKDFSDLLLHLGLNVKANDRTAEIAKFKSGNPTVIRREYTAAKKKSETLATAKERGLDLSNEEEAMKSVAKADKDKADKALKTAITKAINNLAKYVG